MCTAVSYFTKDHYFGRNLDLEYAYQETVTITPRNYPFYFRNGTSLPTHYALIGMATISDNYPLYYEATNEKGLSLAGLNFPNNAVYYPSSTDKDNIAPFELIPWVLGQCGTVSEAKTLLSRMNLWNQPFSAGFPLSPLHWLLSDKDESLTIETVADGMKIYENPVGVLTNNPPFDYHMYHLSNYMNLTVNQPENRFSRAITLSPYSLGMGAIGLPGDLSSSSRFVRAVFTKMNSVCDGTEAGSVSQFFHILGSVIQQRGLNAIKEQLFEFTRYSSCCNTTKGIYYYITYDNRQITGVNMHNEDLASSELISYPLNAEQQINMQN